MNGRHVGTRQLVNSSTVAIAAIFFGVLFVYLLSMPRDLTWSYFGGDGGELITASVTLGIPHPPGYPTYVLLGKLFGLMPFGTIAARYNFFSALSMSLAATFITIIVLERRSVHAQASGPSAKHTSLTAAVAGLIFAFMPLVWSQALVAEVYALNVAILAGLLWALVSGRSPILAGILFGLSLTTHLTSLLILPLCLFIITRKDWSRFLFGSLLGLAPLLLLFIFSAGPSPIIWGQPDNLKDWLWVVSGRLYQPNLLSLGLAKWAERIFSWSLMLVVLIIISIVSVYRLRVNQDWRSVRRDSILMLVTALFFGIYAFGYSTPDAIVLLLPGIMLVTVVIGSALEQIGRFSLIFALVIFISGSLFIIGEKEPLLRGRFEQALAQIPEGAIVITPGDQTVAATYYFAYAEAQRADIIVVDDHLFQFSWYRRQFEQRYPELAELHMDDLQLFVDTNQQKYPVCMLSMVHENDVNCYLPPA